MIRNFFRLRQTFAARLLLIMFLSPAADPAIAGPEDAGRGHPVWRGQLDAVSPRAAGNTFDLSADGTTLLYYQGAPWPRLMEMSLEGNATHTRMLSSARPLITYPARFGPDGKVYFTVRNDNSGRFRPGVASVGRLGRETIRLSIAEGRASYSVLLDILPEEHIILIGWGAESIPGASNFEAPDFPSSSLQPSSVEHRLAEWNVSSGKFVDLGISARTARYAGSEDILFETREASGGEYILYSRERKIGRKIESRFGRALPCGDWDATTYLAPHRGGFGQDAFLSHLLIQRGGETERVLNFTAAVGRVALPRPQPLWIRGHRILLRGGYKDEPEYLIAEFMADRELAASSTILFDMPFEMSAVPLPTSRHHADAARIIDSLRNAPGAAVLPGFVKLRLSLGPLGNPKESTTVEVLESRAGLLRIEHILSFQGTEGGSTDIRQVYGFDGTTCWDQPPEGDSRDLSPTLFCRELNLFSMLRHLDPLGLHDRYLRFTGAMSTAQPGNNPSWELQYEYPDGFRGRCLIEKINGKIRCLAWKSPLVLAQLRREKELGKLPSEMSITYHDWRITGGREVPHEIRFDSGHDPFVLRIESIEFPASLDPASFRRPR